MKNILSYYYNLHPIDIYESNNNYFFEYDNDNYVLQMLAIPYPDVTELLEVNKKMMAEGILVHVIITNNENNVVTYINKKPYVLLRFQLNINGEIEKQDIYLINERTTNINASSILDRSNWVELWEIKNDYFEAQISEIGNKYPIISSYLNYYIGLAENAILYVKNAIKIDEDVKTCICHKRIQNNEKLFLLYNPLFLIKDYYVRDICEYIKSVFLINKKKAFDLVIYFFNTFNVNYKEALLFYGRLLYPSYFFDLYDDIVNGIKKEEEINNIIIQSSSYEQFLKNVYVYISKLYINYVPSVEWLLAGKY